MPRAQLIGGLALVALAGVALLFADTGPLPAREYDEDCVNWWCSERNRWPVGLGMLLAGLGLIAVLKAAIGSAPPGDAPPARTPVAAEPHSRPPLRRPRRRRRP